MPDANEPTIAVSPDVDMRANASTEALKDRRTSKHPGWAVLITLSLLMGFASISTDLYLPALPAMARGLAARSGTMEYTISGYLVGFSVGQLLWGPISDRIGRRLPVAIGLILFMIGSAGCALSTNALMIIAWRVFQAVGASAGVVLSRAMVRDLYQGSRAAQMLSTLITVMAIAPLVGPLLGGQILTFAGWRAIFFALVGIGAITLFALYHLPETLPQTHRNPAPLTDAMLDYVRLIGNRQVMGFAIVGAFFYGGCFAYIAGSPFSYINVYHVPAPLYGVLFGINIIAIMGANLINARLVKHIDGITLLRMGSAVAMITGAILAIDGRTGFGGLAGLIVPLFFFNGMTGFIVANSIAGALNAFPQRSGAVSALVGALQYGMGIAGSGLVGACTDGTPWPLGMTVGIAGALSCVVAWFVIRSSGDPAALGH